MSRGKFYRIGDMTPEQVIIYLKQKKIPSELHMKTIEFIGGRINHLKNLVSEIIDNGLTFDGKIY